jgi:hypothetical protein
MLDLRPLTDAEREALRDEARNEFPGDEMMQEVHLVRLLQAAQMRDLAPEERVARLNRFLPSPARPY